jgi:hypothetical protein
MPAIRLVNNSLDQVSTSIGTVTAGVGQILVVQYDTVPIPHRLYEELESLRQYNRIDYSIIDDTTVRDEVEYAPYITGLAPDFNKIGQPTDGDYSDGYFTEWTEDTLIADAVDKISETILQMAPEKAGLLTSQFLVLTGVTQYTAKIPSGNTGAWPTPGSTINNLIISGSYRLDTRWSP